MFNLIGFANGSGISSIKTETSHCNEISNRSRCITEGSEADDLMIGELDLSNDSDKPAFRKRILDRQLSGDPSKLNHEIPLNTQAKIVTYNPKLEIDRSNFDIGQMLGSGNFGSVYKGKCQLEDFVFVTSYFDLK